MRSYSLVDKLCLSLDQVIRAVSGCPKNTGRPNPAAQVAEAPLSPEQRHHSIALMRINHAGEVSAQALYQGQGLVSHSLPLKKKMEAAAYEEGDHLVWCHQRIMELGGQPSYLNLLWYTGSFIIGMTAGAIGDQWSLGFLAETEQQVINHIERHLKHMTNQDKKSHVILQQMQVDEAQHRQSALAEGGVILPTGIKKIMGFLSKIMVKTAYWI